MISDFNAGMQMKTADEPSLHVEMLVVFQVRRVTPVLQRYVQAGTQRKPSTTARTYQNCFTRVLSVRDHDVSVAFVSP